MGETDSRDRVAKASIDVDAQVGELDKSYVDVVVPLSLHLLTFGVSDEHTALVEPGRAVVIQLGARKFYMGIVWRVHKERPKFKKIKNIVKVVDGVTLVTASQLKLWEWVWSYYMCMPGDVMRAALPAALKPTGYSEKEFERHTFKPRMVKMVGLGEWITDRSALNELFERLKRAKKQYESLLELVEKLPEGELFSAKTPREGLSADGAILKMLEGKGIIQIEEDELTGCELAPMDIQMPLLTDIQQTALEDIERGFMDKDVVLLHGVTGCGKTEVYINMMARVLSRGEDVLYLLPEIALTTQLIGRIRAYFGNRVVVYHSRFSDRRRGDIHRELSTGSGGRVIIGVRSAIFLPIHKLGLVVVDEEHETSFKQADPAPRYHARDAAIVLASICSAKTLLGSATPSIESHMNAIGGKYGHVQITERYGEAIQPRIIISDTLRAAKRGERTSHYSKLLLDKIAKVLDDGSQVMLFQNRRGFSPYVECPNCGWVASCPNCNVTLTLHKGENVLKCHYCGHKHPSLTTCPACRQGAPVTKGFGTEKIEEELQQLFPSARIARLDRDTTQTEKGYMRIINDFQEHKTDILIGTQMITKGFDFSGVSLVGILNADNLLNYPDFRACERAFQLMTQVAGRAGRRKKQGEVVIQTSQPQHPIIDNIIHGDYQSMTRMQLAQRQSFFYPPYCRLIAITMKHRDKELLWRAAVRFDALARKVFGRRLLGPESPAVDRIKNEYIVGFIVKIERERSSERAKELLRQIKKELLSDPAYRNITVFADVDPQ